MEETFHILLFGSIVLRNTQLIYFSWLLKNELHWMILSCALPENKLLKAQEEKNETRK